MIRSLLSGSVCLVMVCAASHSWAAPKAPKHDCSADGKIEAGPPPALSIFEIDYGVFRYPRTLPLKASATDTDLLTVRCPSCDGSEAQVPVADDVHPGEDARSGYRWVLTSGPGSLNGPYDARPIMAAEADRDAARSALERLKRDSREADELVTATQSVVTALEATREKFARRLEAARERVDTLDEELTSLAAREKIAVALLAGPEAQLSALRDAAGRQLAADLEGALAAGAPVPKGDGAHQAKQDEIDKQIQRLRARFALLGGHVPRALNLVTAKALNQQIEELEPQRRARHAVTCQFATEVVPLLLTLKSAHRGAVRLNETQSAVREFLTLCDPANVPGYETLVTALPPLSEACALLAHGVPGPTPVELEMIPTCGAVYHELQVLDEMRELHRRLDETHNAGGVEYPRREMKAIRAKLRTLHDQRAEGRDAWAAAQRARLDGRTVQQLVSDEVRARRDAADEAIAAVSSVIASAKYRIRTLRAAARRARDQRAESEAAWNAAEARHRYAEGELTVAWAQAKTAVEKARLAAGAVATAEARAKNATKAVVTQRAALSANDRATGQVAWYSPPPLALLLAEDAEARNQLDAAREADRKATAALEDLEAMLEGNQSDQLERLEGLFGAVGDFKSLVLSQRQLELQRRQLNTAIQGRVSSAVDVAEARRERLRVARAGLQALRTDEAFIALAPRYEELQREREAAVVVVATAKRAIDPAFKAYRDQLRRQQEVRGEMSDKVIEMKTTVATSLEFRAKVFESHRAIALQRTFDSLLTALLVGESKRLASDDDKRHREAIARRIEATEAAIRSDEQAAEDTKSLVAAQLAELKSLTDKEARVTRKLAEAKNAYEASRVAWRAAVDALDDHDAKIVTTRQALSLRWTAARKAATHIMSLLGADTTAIEGDRAFLVDAVIRDALLSVPTAKAAFREGVIAVVDAFHGGKLVARPGALATLDPLIEAARDRLNDMEKLASDRRGVYASFPGTTLASLHRERDQVEDALGRNTRARAAAAKAMDRDLKEAKRRRDLALGTALTDARARASAASDQYETRRQEITRRLVSRIAVTLSLEATDRGAAAGRADDPPAKTIVQLTFGDTLEARATAPPVRRRDVRPSTRDKGTCKPMPVLASGRRPEWVQTPRLPETLFAGEAIGTMALARDMDLLTPSCDARGPGCKRGKRAASMQVEEFHPTTWTVDNDKGFSGGAGRLEGGPTTPAGIFVAPAPTELVHEGAPVCAKPVILSVATMADGDLAKESAPAAKQAKVLIKAGIIEASKAPLVGLPGQPLEVSFRLYKQAENGVPLPANVPFDEPLDGQKVQLKVERVSGTEDPGSWGFDGTKRAVTSVSRRGKVSETLTLSVVPGRYRVTATWREGAACGASVDVVTSTGIASRMLYAPAHPAWSEAVLALVNRGQVAESDLNTLVRELVSSTSSVDLNDDWAGSDELGVDDLGLTRERFTANLQHWAIATDRDHRPVQGQALRVTATDRGGLVRSAQGATSGTEGAAGNVVEVATDAMGLIRTHLSTTGVEPRAYPRPGQSAGVRVELVDPAAPTYQPTPYPVTNAWAPEGGLQQAWMGPRDPAGTNSEYFRLDLARTAVPDRVIEGEATLVAPLFRDDGGLATVTLPGTRLNGVVLDGAGMAVAGEAVFDADSSRSGCTSLKGGGELCIRHLSLRTGHDAAITGVVTLPLGAHKDGTTSTGPLHFAGNWTPGDGVVLTLLSGLPTLPLVADGSATFERGNPAVLDLSHRTSPPGLPATWKGLWMHRSRLALHRLRAVASDGQSPFPSPVVHLSDVAWSWPFSVGQTVGSIDTRGISLPLPGMHGAELTGLSADLRGGALTVGLGDVAIVLPGTRDPVHGQLSSVDGAWNLTLVTPAPVRLGEWTALSMRAGAHGVLTPEGLSRLRGELDVTIPGMTRIRLPGLDHDPKADDLNMTASNLSASSLFAGRFTLAVTGGGLDTTQPPNIDGLPSASVYVKSAFAFPSGVPAPGSVTLTVGDDGVDVGAQLEASAHFAGVAWRGALRYQAGDFQGTLKAGEASRVGLSRVASPELRTVMGTAPGTEAYMTLRGAGEIVAPKDLSASSAAFFDTPYVAVDGSVQVGWNHTAPEEDFSGYAERRAADPLQTRGTLVLSDRGDGATLAARVDMVFAEGRDPVAMLDGEWTYFNRPGVVFGHGQARVRARGQVEGHVDLQLDIDTPGGELLHVMTPVDFVARGGGVRLASGRFEGLMAEARIHAVGDVHLAVDAASKSAELQMTTRMATRANWDWPSDDSLGVFQVDFVTDAMLQVLFEGSDGGAFKLAPGETSWSGVVSGPLSLGFNTSLVGGTIASGKGVACFPELCLKAGVNMPTEHLGFAFDMGLGWVEFGSCTRECAR